MIEPSQAKSDKVEDDSKFESAIYSTLVSLLQSRKKSGVETAISEIVKYGKQGGSNTKNQVRSANLKEWSDAIHHTWIGELDENKFVQALKVVALFSKHEIDQCLSSYFKKYVFNIDSHGLSLYQTVAAEDSELLVVHAFGNSVKEECLDETAEPINANDFVGLNSDRSAGNSDGSTSSRSLRLDVYEDQEIQFSFTTTDNSKVFIENFDISVRNESGEVVSDSMIKSNNTNPYLQLCNCQMLKSIVNSTLNVRMVFRLGNGPEEYLYRTD